MPGKPENPGSQGQANRPDKTAPNPAGHQRGNQRPEGMTDEQWEAERDRVNRERFEEKQGRPRPEGDEGDAGTETPSTPTA